MLGGGGTARSATYAATMELGLKRIDYNRTPGKATDLAESFGGTVITNLDQDGEDSSLGGILSSDGATTKNI
jgi:shikimate 5-dehydrogenase